MGTSQKGEANGRSKLTTEEVLEIKQLLTTGLSNGIIAYKFKVGKTCIQKIHSGRTWKHLSIGVK